MSDCELTELPQEMCAHCLGHDKTEAAAELRVITQMSAKFDGRCFLDKSHSISAGELIIGVGDDEGVSGWACESCGIAVSDA